MPDRGTRALDADLQAASGQRDKAAAGSAVAARPVTFDGQWARLPPPTDCPFYLEVSGFCVVYQSSGLPHDSHTRLQIVPYTAAIEVLS